MRIAVVLVTSALVAGCSSGTGGSANPAAPTSSPPAAFSATSSAAPPPSPVPTSAPAAGAAIGTVIAWIEAGAPADPAGFHSMTRDGETTALNAGVAFTTAGAEANCVTNEYANGALACLVKLTNPPPRPADFPTAWKNNWVDFPGTTVDVGSPHGDPGPFVDGTGAELPAGRSLSFGDYRCRADPAGLFCVDYAHQSAIKLSAAGIVGFGCLKNATPPPDIGIRLSC